MTSEEYKKLEIKFQKYFSSVLSFLVWLAGVGYI